jgi:predicted GIY-YIG superfamily endonuclease
MGGIVAERRPKRRYLVYVIKLRKSVLRSRAFRRDNPAYQKGKPCVYVGQTSQTREDRFQQHLTDRQKGSKWVRKYGKALFLWAYQDLPEFPTQEEAIQAEKDHAEELRSRGWGVWQR